MKVKGEVNFGPKQACIPSASKAKGKRSVADLDGSKEEEEGSPIEDSSSFAADSDVVFGEETEGATFNHTNDKGLTGYRYERKKDRYPVNRKESPAGNNQASPPRFSSRASFLAYLLGQVELFTY